MADQCRECNQGLGGHVVGHKNRRMMMEAAAAAAASGVVGDADAVACRGGAKPKKVHVCSKCGQVYPSGVSLGGHMRKHCSGTPIVPKKRHLAPPPVAAIGEAQELVLTLAVQAAQAPPLARPAMQAAQPALVPPALEPTEPAPAPPPVEVAPQPAQAPAPVAGSVRIFGVTIVQPQEDSSDED